LALIGAGYAIYKKTISNDIISSHKKLL